MSMITPSDARRRILAAATVIDEIENVTLAEGFGRTLGSDLVALHTQPPFDASAMDGYAVRAADLAIGVPLKLIGQSAAGHPFSGHVGSMETVRIFTGAMLPEGADTILIQENAEQLSETMIAARQIEAKGRFVRSAGLDFHRDDMLLAAGTLLDARHLGLAASMGHAALPVRRKPRIALLSTGDELVRPGDVLKPGQIISSNSHALVAGVKKAGGDPLDVGVVPDNMSALCQALEAAAVDHDLLLTIGGASIGDHDHVQAALIATGFTIDFWKVAVRPGKPLIFGRRGRTLCVGLPGNPVSSMVCTLLFVAPLIRRMLGQPAAATDTREPARLTVALPPNDSREEYMRASLGRDAAGVLIATPLESQDSSLQRLLVQADALLIRPAFAPEAAAGDTCEIIRL